MEKLLPTHEQLVTLDRGKMQQSERVVQINVQAMLERGYGDVSIDKPNTHNWKGFPEIQPATEAGAVVTAGLHDYLRKNGVLVSYENLGRAAGRYTGDKVLLDPTLKGNWVASALTHEAGHHVLGHQTITMDASMTYDDMWRIKSANEIAVESATWIVLTYFGVENPRNSFDYIAGHFARAHADQRLDEFESIWAYHTPKTMQASEALIKAIITANPYAATLANKV